MNDRPNHQPYHVHVIFTPKCPRDPKVTEKIKGTVNRGTHASVTAPVAVKINVHGHPFSGFLRPNELLEREDRWVQGARRPFPLTIQIHPGKTVWSRGRHGKGTNRFRCWTRRDGLLCIAFGTRGLRRAYYASKVVIAHP